MSNHLNSSKTNSGIISQINTKEQTAFEHFNIFPAAVFICYGNLSTQTLFYLIVSSSLRLLQKSFRI